MTRLALRPVPVPGWPQGDRQRWLASREPAGPFDDDAGLAANWRAPTIRNCERGYGIWLAWLTARGELATEALPSSRVTRERIEAFLADYRPGRAPATVAGTLRGIAYVLRACEPPDGVAWLTKLAHRLTNTARPVRPKLPRMAPVAAIAGLGAKLMAEGLAQLDRGKRSGAVIYRDGLLFALLIRRPLRRSEMWRLQLGTTFRLEDGIMRIRIDGRNTKSGIAPAELVPAGIVPGIATYLDKVRPVLLRPDRPDEGWFWLNRRGGRLALQDITTRIARLSRQHLGRDLSPHLFRDCAATTIALEAPERIGISKSVLAHASLATSQTFYNQATGFAAVAKHGDLLRSLYEDGDQE
ncbi:MAG: tyrosine-type recombinase/integrase [Novosphingobium sp.]